MASIPQKVPMRIIQAIEQEKLSKHHIIYYDIEHEWVCQQRDDAFINSLSTPAENNASTNLPSIAHPLEELGPFGVRPTEVSLSIIGDTNTYQMTVDQRLSRLNLVDGYGQHAPMAPITLTGRALDVAYIPHNATHFCWIYPPIGVTQLTKQKKVKLEQEILNGNLEYTFLALGGFAYFRFEKNSYQILQTNCLVQADNGLTFEGPFPWHPDYTAHLAKQGRFQSATISSLLELGIKYYCFINPSEKLTSSKSDSPDWMPAPNGGFIYLYNSKLKPHIYDRYFSISDKPRSEQISTRIMPFSLIHKRNKTQTATSNTSPVDKNNNFQCSICLERTIRCIFIPCKHMCTCNQCAEEIRQRNNSVCPICRQIFREKKTRCHVDLTLAILVKKNAKRNVTRYDKTKKQEQTSMSGINFLPITVIQELERAAIPHDSLIFYQNNRWLYQTGSTSSGNNQFSYHPIDSLGPFGIHPVNVSFILYPDTSQYTITKIGNRELKDEQRATGIFAPIAQITLQGFASDIANIPNDATHFCWLYPPNNTIINDDMNWDNSHEFNLLKLGGFAYFIANESNLDKFQLVRVNSLIISADNGLTFEGPNPWRTEFTEQLWNEKRFHPVSLSNLREKGAKYFAFINPYESFVNEIHKTPWTPSPHGAFAYLFNEDHSPHPLDCYFSVADNCLGFAPSDGK